MMIRNVNASRQWIRALRWGNSAVCCGRRGKKDEQEGGEGEETETVAIAGVRVADMRNEENNSTLPKLAKIGLGRKRVTDWRGVWPGSLLSLLLPAVLSPGRFLALSPRWAA